MKGWSKDEIIRFEWLMEYYMVLQFEEYWVLFFIMVFFIVCCIQGFRIIYYYVIMGLKVENNKVVGVIIGVI